MMLSGKRVLIFAGPLAEDMELLYPLYRLREEGAEVVVAGLGDRQYTGKKGHPIEVDTDVDVLGCDHTPDTGVPFGVCPPGGDRLVVVAPRLGVGARCAVGFPRDHRHLIRVAAHPEPARLEFLGNVFGVVGELLRMYHPLDPFGALRCC